MLDPQLRTVLQIAAVWAALGAFELLVACAGGRKQLEKAGFFRPYYDLIDLADIVFGRTIIVVCAGPALVMLSDFRSAIGQTLVKFGHWLRRLAKKLYEA